MVSAERIVVTLTGGAPWGFRLSGGGGLPLTINKIRKKSAAHNKGLKEGDAVISINGVKVHDKTQDESLELVEKAGDTLALEIFRGDIDELSLDKPKKTIQIGAGKADSAPLSFTANVDDVSDAGATFAISTSFGEETSNSYEGDVGGIKLLATVDDVSGSTFDTGASSTGGFTITASVDDMSATSNTQALESSPIILADFGDMNTSIHSAEVEAIHASSVKSPVLAAEPFIDTHFISSSPNRLSPNPPRASPRSPVVVPIPPPASPKSPQHLIVTQSVSPQPQKFTPQVPQPVIKAISPKPIAPGVTSNITTSAFNDGQTRSFTTKEQHVQTSTDGKSTSMVNRQTTTTTTVSKGPKVVKNQGSAFKPFTPTVPNGIQSKKSTVTTSSTSFKTSSQPVAKDQNRSPMPFSTSFSDNLPPPSIHSQLSPSISSSKSTGSISGVSPVFKPTKFVPGSSKKEIPGLFITESPLVDSGVSYDGKENKAPPKPMFQVTNIVADKSKRQSRDIWRPNLWLPGQKPPSIASDETPAATPRDDFSPYNTFPVPKVKAGRSLVEEQKKKLLRAQSSKSQLSDFYDDDFYDGGQSQHFSHKLHVFAPPVEIHADDDYHGLDDFEECPSSPDSSTIRRRKNLYSDSAFYDTPGKSYPTITEQMKLCKKIAQSLTSAANKRARGAKMFMRRRRKSNKWVHEGGHSEWSSSAGDVANIVDLESELSPDEGGGKPLLYFKIPNLKHRVSKDTKQTKMALTQAQFEKLRLNSKKCDHRALPPDTCFDIVADLKASKGRGGRMFERRRQRSDKYVLDENNARHPIQQTRLDFVLTQPLRQDKTPWEAAMTNQGNVDEAFSHISEWERNQKMNQILKTAAPKRFHQPIERAPVPVVQSSLKNSDSIHLLRGRDFNRRARGWLGGGEYPIAERMQHISPTRSSGLQHSQAASIQSHQDFNQKVKPFHAQPGPTLLSSPAQNTWELHPRNEWQAPSQDTYQNGYHSLDRHSTTNYGSTSRPKSWASDGIDGYVYRDEPDYTYAPVDFRHMEDSFPKVAYMQPIIPGTDL